MIYVLKLSLCSIEPPIWRRLQVPAAITLPKLHRVIQVSLNWEDYHLHRFEIKHRVYEIPDPEDLYPTKALDERRVKLAQVVDKVGAEFRYLYDFGDNWEHHLLVESIVHSQQDAIYPQCTDGARNGPPEDAGGPFGYQDYLHAMADPAHEEHEEKLAWRGPFDPERFDLKAINRRLASESKPRPAGVKGRLAR